MSKRLTFVSLMLVSLLLLAPGTGVQATSHQASSLSSSSLPQRWIVRLVEPPLAQAPNVSPGYAVMAQQSATSHNRLQVDSPAAVRYRDFLRQRQTQVFASIRQTFPAAQVERSYQVVFNGMSLTIPGADTTVQDQLQSLSGVAEVYQEQAHELHMYASLPQMNTAALWNHPSIGGQTHAGEGIKIAVIDTGIAINHPFFNPDGYAYPDGFPKGEVEYTTPKVIVSRAYFRPDIPPTAGSETPLPGPLDASHGTHVAGTAAGVANTLATFFGIEQVISGVAPRAYLMNYKAFYDNDSIFAGLAFETELMAALEDAVIDGADVISNSWGGRANTEARFSPISVAANAAADAGVTVVFSVGNDGPYESTADSGDFTNKLIMVGATTTSQTIAAGFVDVAGPGAVPETLKGFPYGGADFGPLLEGDMFGPASYVPVETLAASPLACEPLPAGSLQGKIALMERGTCHFSVKAFHAQQAGAIAAIIYNSEDGGDSIISMGGGDYADEVTIPAVFIGHTDGMGLFDWYNRNGDAAQVQIDPRPRVIDMTPDMLASFSSRGPAFSKDLKPDVVAPGINILSSGYSNAEGIEAHLGFGLSTGTSMSAPHVSGAVALLKQAHPDWSSLAIKSALMSTASTDIWLDMDRTTRARVLDRGAGRVDLGRAVHAGLIFNPPSVSLGHLVAQSGQSTYAEQSIQVQNVSGASQSYTTSGTPLSDGQFAIHVSPSSFTLAAGETIELKVAIDIPAGASAGEYEGQVDVQGPQHLHLPLWGRLLPAERGPKVLLVDNDGSSSLDLADYSAYYTNLLDELNVDYTYLDVDALAPIAQTLPDAIELLQHEVVLWFTGDNTFFDGSLPVPTPLTIADQNILIAYLHSGGSLIATGQNIAEVSDIETFPDDTQYGRSELYRYFLGARFIQENVYEGIWGERPLITGNGYQHWLSGIRLNIGTPTGGAQPDQNTSAGNQSSVDEVKVIDMDPRMPDEYTFPIFTTSGAGKQDEGIVGLHRFSTPTLESPTPAFDYRTTYLAFGLEGIRNDTGTTSRKELLQSLLFWHVDYPAVMLDSPAVVTTPNQSVQLTANATSNVPGFFVRYRWDFGDGTPVVETQEPTVDHIYAEPGTYHARVEVTDNWGHTAVSGVPNIGDRRPIPSAQATDAVTSAGNGQANGATQAVPAAVPAQAPGTNELVTFAETGHTLSGRFLDYWRSNGSLDVFGYPIAAQHDGEVRSQVFERARFEHHPEQQAPYDVLLSRLGVEALEQQGRDWQTFSRVDDASVPDGCLYFAETGHSLCGGFKAYWESHGLEFDGEAGSSFAESLALFGLPISEPIQETIAGTTLTVQWFERARFEYHETSDTSLVLLGLLGNDVYGPAQQ